MRINHLQAIKILENQLAENSFISAVSFNIILKKIESYVTLLLQWNRSYNLIASKTAENVWERHIVDSAQIWTYLFPPSLKEASTQNQRLVDLGTGAGFPGMVLAIMGWPQVTLVESNQKKVFFLHEVIRHLSLSNVTIISQRIEKISSLQADIIVARALAPLTTLLTWTYPHLDSSGKCLFHKGARWEEELTQAKKYWTMLVKPYPSITDKAGVILEINDLDYVHTAGKSV